MNDLVTADLSKFGSRELSEAGDLLKIYAEGGVDFLDDGITINFNPNSGYVFLSDEDYNVGMLEEGKIKQWFNCGECGEEGFKEHFQEEGLDKCEGCKEIKGDLK